MYIEEININKFRHLEDMHLGPFPKPPDQSELIVLAGPNGGGKSSILELLSYALSNSFGMSWQIYRSFPPNNSFEVEIAITPEELQLIYEYIGTSSGYAKDMLKYLEDNLAYYRSFNYLGGKYQEKSGFHNQIHDLVTNALRNHYNRSPGLFLRSDRYYPSGGFERGKLIQNDQSNLLNNKWNMAFNTSDVQYRDMFDFLVQQRYHYYHNLGAYYHRLETATSIGEERPLDPLKPYDDLLQKLFPDYSFTEKKEDIPSNLFIKLPSNDEIPFSDLSSGEKEIFFILSFFLRHDVANAIIVVDEPEMHLHPELARLLVRTMRRIKPGNQLWLATHNTEIIDEAGRDRVYYIARHPETMKSFLTLGTDEKREMRLLKDLFGYSGYIGIARSMVFLEGRDSSFDRKVFSSLFPKYESKLKFIPSNSSSNLPRINAAILSILESNIGWTEFYLIRDRDFLTEDFIKKYSEHSSGRIYVLKRHEIENYLLDDNIISKVQTEIFGKPISPEQVRDKLSLIARNISGEVFRDMLVYRMNLIYRLNEDFSLGKYMNGQALFGENGSLEMDKIEVLKKALDKKTREINLNLSKHTETDAINILVLKCQEELKQAVMDDRDGWRSLFPGKRLLETYSKMEGLGEHPVLQNTIIKELSMNEDRIPSELDKVMPTIAEGGRFSASI